MSRVYDTQQWAGVRERVLARDRRRCTVGTLVGGRCSGRKHVHHLTPVADGGDPFDEENLGTACARHHPWWENARRVILDGRGWKRCKHPHRSRDARAACERRLNSVV